MNAFDSTDLWFPEHIPPLGRPHAGEDGGSWFNRHDPLRYVVWVDPGRGNDEQAPRTALHVQASP